MDLGLVAIGRVRDELSGAGIGNVEVRLGLRDIGLAIHKILSLTAS